MTRYSPYLEAPGVDEVNTVKNMGDGQTVCPQIWGKRKNQNLHLLAAVEVSLLLSVFFGSDCETAPPSHHLIWQ